ncbi:hypothetical protein [Microcoleus sp. herbarium2]
MSQKTDLATREIVYNRVLSLFLLAICEVLPLSHQLAPAARKLC